MKSKNIFPKTGRGCEGITELQRYNGNKCTVVFFFKQKCILNFTGPKISEIVNKTKKNSLFRNSKGYSAVVLRSQKIDLQKIFLFSLKERLEISLFL